MTTTGCTRNDREGLVEPFRPLLPISRTRIAARGFPSALRRRAGNALEAGSRQVRGCGRAVVRAMLRSRTRIERYRSVSGSIMYRVFPLDISWGSAYGDTCYSAPSDWKSTRNLGEAGGHLAEVGKMSDAISAGARTAIAEVVRLRDKDGSRALASARKAASQDAHGRVVGCGRFRCSVAQPTPDRSRLWESATGRGARGMTRICGRGAAHRMVGAGTDPFGSSVSRMRESASGPAARACLTSIRFPKCEGWHAPLLH
jgi:hypothetical protein